MGFNANSYPERPRIAPTTAPPISPRGQRRRECRLVGAYDFRIRNRGASSYEVASIWLGNMNLHRPNRMRQGPDLRWDSKYPYHV
jgi:hypothetical protein